MAPPQTVPDPAALLEGDPGDKDRIRAALAEARERTWHLVEGLSDEDLETAATEFLSPPVWDLGHMANFEELWLVQRLAGRDEMRPGYNHTYNAFEHPRPERPSLELLDRDGVRAYMEAVRAQALEVLGRIDLEAPLTRDGFVHWMLVLHEHQHQETLLQSLQMRGAQGRYDPPTVRRLPEPGDTEPGFVTVPAGPFPMGVPHGPGVYDNEAPPHEVDVPAFAMARYPVTCGEYLAFMEDGGYEDRRLWSERGRDWLDASDAHRAPRYWRQDPDRDGAWVRDGPGCSVPVADWPDIILSHVTHFEAEAYAAWAGARLPTEAEWEKACRWDPATGEVVGRNPWGEAPATTARANVDQLAFAPSRIGAFPQGASPVGCQHMLGDAWEWTASKFEPYPGFEAFPYREYSEVFFGGDFRVLRGGSWATRASCATGTFRNWDHPYRRQIMSGIRLARDA